ncbi:hypothetical protein DFH06DRAFT_1194120 [Mycena polygramma]|nr:hypothetical protein DFH06DRAFT_1194120 [Mycena polygramma]
MHESLHPRNISKIEGSLRPIAEAAAAGSLEDLNRLRSLVPELPNAQAVLLLPVLIANLDISRIPQPHDLDDLLVSSPMPQVECALVALLILSFLRNPGPESAYPDIWAYVWPWIDFIHFYRDSLPAASNTSEMFASFIHALVILALAQHMPTHSAIGSTPRVRRILAMAWKALICNDGLWAQAGTYEKVLRLLVLLTPRPGQSSDFEEIVEAVGGDVTDLASVFVTHVSRAQRMEAPKNHIAGFLALSMSLLSAGDDGLLLFRTAVQSFSLVPALVTAILALHGPPPGDAVDLCFTFLVEALKLPPGHTYMVQALRAGLLRCIILFGRSPSKPASRPTADTDSTPALIRELLEEVLPCSLVHYTVVMQFRRSISDVKQLSSSITGTSAFSKQWQLFSAYIKARQDVWDFWDEQFKVRVEGCDNALCGKIHDRSRFKSCSNCRSAHYCSKDCQTLDWLDGHKQVCRKLRSFHQRHLDTINTRGKRFLRTLLTYDAFQRLADLSMDQLLFMYEHPGEAFFTAFAYNEVAGLKYRIEPEASLTTQGDESELWDLTVPAHFARAKKSGGRLQVHVMYIYEGHKLRSLIFPLRTDRATLYNGLRQIVQSLPRGLSAEQVCLRARRKVDDLVGKKRSMTYVH